MVYSYRRALGSRRYADYTQEQLSKCLDMVNVGRLTVTEASRAFQIPRSTIYSKLTGAHRRITGHPKIFSEEEEKSFVNHLTVLADWGFPIGLADFRVTVQRYLVAQKRCVPQFKEGLPGKGWVYRFLRDHQELSCRMSQNIKIVRAAINPAIIKEYMDHLNISLVDVPPSNIFNYDETNVADDPGKQLAICKRGMKYFESIRNTSKAATSLMFCGSAAGEMLPPYIVFKASHLWSTWTNEGPENVRYGCTKSGWFDADTFEDWFKSLFLPARQYGTLKDR